MGREIRRVPPDWDHPKESKFDFIKQTEVERYTPMLDQDADTAWQEWQAEYNEWVGGAYTEAIEECGPGEIKENQPYAAFCEWNGPPPDPEYHRPRWAEGEATWFQVYETVSEGTPVTPPFETQQELIDYLVTNGDFWDQARRKEGRSIIDCEPWSRETAEHFVLKTQYAPSLVSLDGVVQSGVKAALGANSND